MKRYRVVIDTNVLHAGLYSAVGASYQILRLVERGRVVPLLSTTLLFEYEEVLMRNREMLALSDQDIDDILNEFCVRGESRKIYFLWRPLLSDPKDDHLLELAMAAGGADIVTHNVRDFKKAGSFGVRIIKPAELLGELR